MDKYQTYTVMALEHYVHDMEFFANTHFQSEEVYIDCVNDKVIFREIINCLMSGKWPENKNG